MIIIKYLLQEVLKSQIAILFILLLIFFCQKLVKILSESVEGEIPINLVLSLLGLGMPEMAQIILPISVLLSLIITLSELYSKNEITVMYACGLSKIVLIKVAIISAFFTSIITTIIVTWIGPWSSRHQDNILAEAKVSLGTSTFMQGQFQKISDDGSILFIENINSGHFYKIFFAHLSLKEKKHPSIIIAESGEIAQRKDGSQILTLKNGTRFEGIETFHNFRIDDFYDCQAIVGRQSIILDSDNAEQMNMYTLWNMNTNRARAEFHWRITLMFTTFIMALIAVPLSSIKPYQGNIFSILLTTLLYLIFFLLQTSIKSNIGKWKIDPVFWTWMINGAYLFLAVTLNLRDTVPICHIQSYFTKIHAYKDKYNGNF